MTSEPWNSLIQVAYDGTLRRLLGVGPDDRTEEQRAADKAQYAAERAAARAVTEHRHDQLLAAAEHPVLRAVLELHAPAFSKYSYYPTCEGCDMEGYECESPTFPCRTYVLVSGVPE